MKFQKYSRVELGETLPMQFHSLTSPRATCSLVPLCRPVCSAKTGSLNF